jgi:hypothetical protein
VKLQKEKMGKKIKVRVKSKPYAKATNRWAW